jgi:hypothetical protein
VHLIHFLNQRLSFVEYFHVNTTASFESIKSKIEAEEPPYVDTRHSDDPNDEPAFLEEWENADAAITVAGAACLDLLQSTLHAFLDEYMNEIGNKQVIPQLRKLEQKSWLGNYKLFFKNYLKIHWEASGADLGVLNRFGDRGLEPCCKPQRGADSGVRRLRGGQGWNGRD